MFKSANFDRLLDRATSLTNLEPDWNAILQICDSIRQNDVQPKYAVNAIKKKLYATNPNVELMALQVLESCVKNCGSTFHIEITSKAFMEELREMVKMSSDTKVRDEVLKLIQVWAHAFRNDPSHRAVQDTVNLMKIEGYKFPVLKESDAMFAADSAPDWADGECCNRCRTQFSVVQRKHHCRNCGQIFCQKCSSKVSTIPKYGIEKDVRVCDDCYDKLNKTGVKSMDTSTAKAVSADSSPYNAVKPKSENTKSEREIQEEEELQLALALSQSEAESKERENRSRSLSAPYNTGYGGMGTTNKSSLKSSASPKKLDSSLKSLSNNDVTDPELSRYLNRDYWEQKTMNYNMEDLDSMKPTPSAPQPQPILNTKRVNILSNMSPDVSKPKDKMENGIDSEMDSFLVSLKSAIEIFVNRINSNQLRGRPIANDSAVQSLFMNITNMHSTLLAYIQQQDDSRAHFEALQDKLGQIRDARAALDALREEHRDQMRREAEEAERLRQQQMAQKLEIMRKKKQEYLQYQREIALQRMQEQEREMMMRQEQHKYVWQQQQVPQQVPQQPIPQQQQQIPQSIAQQQVPPQQMMYPPNSPHNNVGQMLPPGPPSYVPYTPATGPQQQQLPTTTTTGHPGYAINNIPTNSVTNPQMYGQQNPPNHYGVAPQQQPQQQQQQQQQQPHSPHAGAIQSQSGINAYNMQPMANALPQMPITNQMPGQGIPISASMGPPNDGIQQQQMQSPNPQAPVPEAPLISFD